MIEVIEDPRLVREAATSKQGREFYTTFHIADALSHLNKNPQDVCMVRYKGKKILLGGPIPSGKAVDVTDESFSFVADSFDVGQMTTLVQKWFKDDFEKDVDVAILESGQIATVGAQSKLICLSRKTPGLLDMATTEDGESIGQYSQKILGHSGDLHSTIGGVYCLHHELGLKPGVGTKLYFLVGYNSLPLRSWRDSRVFWIVYDPDTEDCLLVPHNLSDEAVGDTVSASMAFASKENNNGTISVIHLASPVQASLHSASPLRPNDQNHRAYIRRCMDATKDIDWSSQSAGSRAENGQGEGEIFVHAGDEVHFAPVVPKVDRAVALFDGCTDTLLNGFPTLTVHGSGDSLSTMHGPLKVLARGCCANSRVVLVDGSQSFASSDINLTMDQLSGVIFVKASDPDIYKLNQIRWNMARGAKTPVIAVTPDGCVYLCGPLPPCIQIEDNPTPVAGTLIPDEAAKELISFALSASGDEYFGPLYQPIPTHDQTSKAILDFIDGVKSKDFGVVTSEEEIDSADAFTDDDFRRMMETINIMSVSKSSAIERNHLAIKIAKFLKKAIKRAADQAHDNNPMVQKSLLDLQFLQEGWSGDDMDWAVDNKIVLEELLKTSSIKVSPQEGVIDLALQTKLNESIEKKMKDLKAYISSTKRSTHNGHKKTFNRVFNPMLESLMRSIGDMPRYLRLFPQVKQPNVAAVIIRASQSTNKQSVMANPEDVMKVFHRLGATGFISFSVNFFHAWKSKLINQLCVVDKPGHGFNDPESFAPSSHRIENGPANPTEAYETDIRNQFVLPVFTRLPKTFGEEEEDDDDDDDENFGHMPSPPASEDLADNLLLRAEFTLRDPEQGTKHPLWLYCDWLFHQVKSIHGIVEKEAAPLVMRALGFSILRMMRDNPVPDQKTMEIVASIIHAINFMSARGDPAIIDTFFNMGSAYVPQTKEMERNPWQIEVVNILSRAVDYVRPIMTAKEYVQLRSNFQRGAANVVKRQIVQKLLEHMQEELKKNKVSNEDYLMRVNDEFYPCYRQVVETVGFLIESDPTTFQLTDDLIERINSLHHTIVVDWASNMRRCRVGPVRQMVSALKSFSQKGGEAMAYLVSRKPFLVQLYDQVYHIKYESCDHALVEELCRIIRAKGRNPEHEKHNTWLERVDRIIHTVSCYDTKMSAYAHGNQYKPLPTELMQTMLKSVKNNPESDIAVTFPQIQQLLSHVHIDVKSPSDLYVKSDGQKSVFDQLRGEWWMCPETPLDEEKKSIEEKALVPKIPLIPMGSPESSDILSVLGDTYHKFELARLFSGNLASMRGFIRENYKFHLDWFEDTILAAGLPSMPKTTKRVEQLAVYGVVQRLVCELVEDGADRGDRARDRVYGEVADPAATTGTVLLEEDPDGTVLPQC